VIAGGPVRQGFRLEDAHIYDLFPTVLHLLGLPVPETAAGRVLEEALEEGYRRAAPVAKVASYDALMPLFLPGAGRDGEAEARRREEELEKLRALGYVR
jgi:arylsulfatase A-like enzyme